MDHDFTENLSFHGCFVYTLALCFLYDLNPLSFILMEWYV